jgi:hypothetical protein
VRRTKQNIHLLEIDEFIVMPNHFHGIIVIVGAQFIAPFDCGAINQNKKQGVMNHAPTITNISSVTNEN